MVGNIRTNEELDTIASDYLKKHGLYRIPVDPVRIANIEGIKVNNAVFSDESLSGLIAKRGPNISILINQSEPPYRKRFTIAHELSHHFLHLQDAEDGEFIDSTIDLFRDPSLTPSEWDQARLNEVEANRFAAALLMPKELVQRYYSENLSLEELARIFNVSSEAMGIRLNTLDLI